MAFRDLHLKILTLFSLYELCWSQQVCKVNSDCLYPGCRSLSCYSDTNHVMCVRGGDSITRCNWYSCNYGSGGICPPIPCTAPAGSYCPPDSLTTTACPAGSYCTGGKAIVACPAGMVSPQNSSSLASCVQCPAGVPCRDVLWGRGFSWDCLLFRLLLPCWIYRSRRLPNVLPLPRHNINGPLSGRNVFCNWIQRMRVHTRDSVYRRRMPGVPKRNILVRRLVCVVSDWAEQSAWVQ